MYTRPKLFLPNRLATYLVVAFGLAAAVLPAVADMDWQSTTGVLAGLGVIAAAVLTWLRGWQKDEPTNLLDYKPAAATTDPKAAERLREDIDHLRADLELLSAHMTQISEERAKT